LWSKGGREIIGAAVEVFDVMRAVLWRLLAMADLLGWSKILLGVSAWRAGRCEMAISELFEEEVLGCSRGR